MADSSTKKERVEEYGVRTVKGRWSEWSMDGRGIECETKEQTSGLTMEDLAWLIEPHRDALLPEPSTPAAKAGDGWIRCSERMPEKREMVLFLHPDGLGRGCGFHNGTIWQDMLDPYAQGFHEYEVADVDLWQPMPAPPSPETNGEA